MPCAGSWKIVPPPLINEVSTFTTLTQYLHEAWPFLALVFLIALFLHTRKIRA